MGTYYNELRNRLILAAVNVNSFAAEGDASLNHINYGRLSALAAVVEDFGHKVSFNKTFSKANGYYSIIELKIDGELVISNTNCIV
ncbi:MAG: hypothetical protein ACI4IS_00365 [Acutalibacteraceae bacterium]